MMREIWKVIEEIPILASEQRLLDEAGGNVDNEEEKEKEKEHKRSSKLQAWQRGRLTSFEFSLYKHCRNSNS